MDFQSNYQVRKYDTNKFTNFLVNDFDWNYKVINNKSIFNNKILGNLKNINYEVKNVDTYKKEPTFELFGSLGFLSQLDLRKKLSIQYINYLLNCF